MNWKIVSKKFFQGAAEGAAASAAGITALPGEKNYWGVLVGALIVGALRGGFNAVKHAKTGGKK